MSRTHSNELITMTYHIPIRRKKRHAYWMETPFPMLPIFLGASWSCFISSLFYNTKITKSVCAALHSFLPHTIVLFCWNNSFIFSQIDRARLIEYHQHRFINVPPSELIATSPTFNWCSCAVCAWGNGDEASFILLISDRNPIFAVPSYTVQRKHKWHTPHTWIIRRIIGMCGARLVGIYTCKICITAYARCFMPKGMKLDHGPLQPHNWLHSPEVTYYILWCCRQMCILALSVHVGPIKFIHWSNRL